MSVLSISPNPETRHLPLDSYTEGLEFLGTGSALENTLPCVISQSYTHLLNSHYTLQENKKRSQFWESLFENVGEQQWFVNTKESTPNHNELIVLLKLPSHATGYTGISHGGLLATLIDEFLCNAAYPVLPHHIGVTASLNISYLQPTPSTSWIVIRAIADSKEGSRRADVQADIYLADLSMDELPWICKKPTVTAIQVVVEPKWSDKLH